MNAYAQPSVLPDEVCQCVWCGGCSWMHPPLRWSQCLSCAGMGRGLHWQLCLFQCALGLCSRTGQFSALASSEGIVSEVVSG